MPRVFSGTKLPAVICEKCGHVLAMHDDPELMPDQFHAVCPACKHDGAYLKSQIQEAVAHRKQ